MACRLALPQVHASYRDVADLLAERGLTQQCVDPPVGAQIRTDDWQKFTREYATPYTRWHLDEMVVSIAGRQMYTWRAVDCEGEGLEILVQPQRDKVAALRLAPRVAISRASYFRNSGYASA
jgi:putative transposase